jgi:hypothetical protein
VAGHRLRSTATAPQLEQALAYIQSVNSGDPERLAIAAKAMMAEVTWAYTKLGWELPGVVDPLEAHKDLVDMVEAGDLTRAGALEVAKARALDASTKANIKVNDTAAAYDAALDAAGPQIDALLERLKAADPHFWSSCRRPPSVDRSSRRLHLRSGRPPSSAPTARCPIRRRRARARGPRRCRCARPAARSRPPRPCASSRRSRSRPAIRSTWASGEASGR